MRKTLILLLSIFSITNLSFAQYAYQNGDYNPAPNTTSCVVLINNFGIKSIDTNTGYEVSKLQDFLQDKGFLNSDPTGYFGKLTESAVRSYQMSKGLSSTGYVGPLTRAAIQSDTCTGVYPTPTPNPIPTPITCTMEVRVCPDGSYVGRVGPNCDFAACPYINPTPICTMEMRTCADGSTMPRDPDCTWRADRCPYTPSQPSICTADIIYTFLTNSSNIKCQCPANTVYTNYGSSSGVDTFICRFNTANTVNLNINLTPITLPTIVNSTRMENGLDTTLKAFSFKISPVNSTENINNFSVSVLNTNIPNLNASLSGYNCTGGYYSQDGPCYLYNPSTSAASMGNVFAVVSFDQSILSDGQIYNFSLRINSTSGGSKDFNYSFTFKRTATQVVQPNSYYPVPANPFYQTQNQTCSDGSVISIYSTCPYIYNSQPVLPYHPYYQSTTQTQRCADGSLVPLYSPCPYVYNPNNPNITTSPVAMYKLCPDGSIQQSGATCPPSVYADTSSNVSSINLNCVNGYKETSNTYINGLKILECK